MENITQLIDTTLLKEQEERGKRERSGKYSPSMLGRCFRAQYYNRQDIAQSNPPDVRTLRVFKAGQLFHQFAQQFLPEHQVEVPIDTDLFHGFADIVTIDSVWDIKSQHSQAFWYMEKSDYDVAKERFSNILQVTLYAKILQRPTAKLLFISKDDLTTATYEFDVKQWEPHIATECKTLAHHWEEQTEPPPIPRAYGVNKKTQEPNECYRYCPWRDYCFKCQGKPIPQPKGASND
jgi:hypothetical protein